MTTEISNSPALQVYVDKNKLNYLWLNGERVTGIEGLQLFEDCRQMQQLPAIRQEQRDELNSIINAALEDYTEEGICNNWASLISTAKDYFSEQGYCVISQDKVSVEFRKPAGLNMKSSLQENTFPGNRKLTAADLWKIHQQRKIRQKRRFI